MDKNTPVYIVLGILIIIAGWIMINYKDPVFQNAGLIYVMLILITIGLIYLGNRLKKR